MLCPSLQGSQEWGGGALRLLGLFGGGGGSLPFLFSNSPFPAVCECFIADCGGTLMLREPMNEEEESLPYLIKVPAFGTSCVFPGCAADPRATARDLRPLRTGIFEFLSRGGRVRESAPRRTFGPLPRSLPRSRGWMCPGLPRTCAKDRGTLQGPLMASGQGTPPPGSCLSQFVGPSPTIIRGL